MSYQYIEAPSDESINNTESLFLAGGITGCPDWQSDVAEQLKDLPITVVNPRRKDFEVFKGSSGYQESEIQISWEYHQLRRTSQVIFRFCKETLQPIALYELGAALERNLHSDSPQTIFINVHPEYPRLFDIQIQTSLQKYHYTISEKLDSLVHAVRIYNKNMEILKKLKE